MTESQVPRLFDAHYRDFHADLPFWHKLADRHGGPILELGSGTGRVLFALARAGHRLTGVDNDPAMVQYAAANMPRELTPRIHLVASDLRHLPLAGAYQLAIAPCNTLAYLDDGELTGCLNAVARSLKPGAALAADLPSPSLDDLDPQAPSHDQFHEPQRGTDVQVTPDMNIDRARRKVEVTWRYDEMLPDGRVERVEVPLTYYLRTPERIMELWGQAGFSKFDVRGNYAGSPFSPQSKAMLVTAQRGG
ncbi:MAG: class I SAM-dependent methyltransferase [Anaerolineales bacterium]|nr:class I SAM-dependent methyltransferase [Anaerolineales bacterium]